MKESGVTCSRLHNTSGRAYESAMAIYLSSFPANERHPLDVVQRRVQSGQSRLFIATMAGEPIGMALLWDFDGIPFVLLDYLAMREDCRGRGLGSDFFRFLSDEIQETGKQVVIEVEHPSFGNNRAQRIRRIRFYLDNGAGILRDVPYWLPPLDGTTPTEMLLLISPADEHRVYSQDDVHMLISRLYAELYGRDENDPLLNSFIHALPQHAEITTQIP